jgi:hypothetical protein
MQTEIHLSVNKMAVILNDWFKYTKHSLQRMNMNTVSQLH